MTTVKVKLGSENRRFTIDENSSFDQFTNTLSKLFPLENIKQNYHITYLDEEGDIICLSSNDELNEAIRVVSGIKPPILRLTLVPKKDELGNVDNYILEEYKDSFVQSSTTITSSTTSTISTTPVVVGGSSVENSNWAKKQLDHESKKQNIDHVVKICGKPFRSGGNNVEVNDSTTFTLMEVEPSPPLSEFLESPPLSEPLVESKRKKTVKDTVEEYSQGIINKTNQMSKDITEQTIQYSNQILEGTLPLAKSIHESSLSSSEYISGKLFAPQKELVNSVHINSDSYDEIVNNISHNMDEYSRNTIRDMDEKSFDVNQQTESIYRDITNDVNDYAKGALFIVNEKSTQLLNDLDLVRSKVNTDVNIQFKELNIKPTIEMENKLNFLSTSTIDQMNNMSDNVAKNILEI